MENAFLETIESLGELPAPSTLFHFQPQNGFTEKLEIFTTRYCICNFSRNIIHCDLTMHKLFVVNRAIILDTWKGFSSVMNAPFIPMVWSTRTMQESGAQRTPCSRIGTSSNKKSNSMLWNSLTKIFGPYTFSRPTTDVQSYKRMFPFYFMPKVLDQDGSPSFQLDGTPSHWSTDMHAICTKPLKRWTERYGLDRGRQRHQI